jgi:hypothetical protein
MKIPEIYGDYHNLDEENRIRLTTVGTRRDLAKHGIELKEGLRVTVYMDDADDAGNRDDLMADAVVRYNEKEACWVAEIDWSKVQNRSERKNAIAALGVKNGVVPIAKKPKARRPGKPKSGQKPQRIAKKT